HHAFYTAVINLLKNPSQLQTFSRNCESVARKRSWTVVAAEVRARLKNLSSDSQSSAFKTFPASFVRTRQYKDHSVEQLLSDHHAIGQSEIPGDAMLAEELRKDPNDPKLHLWIGLRHEHR